MKGRILLDLYPIQKLQNINGYRDTFSADMVHVNMVNDACIESVEQAIAVDASQFTPVTALGESIYGMENHVDNICNECAGHKTAVTTPSTAAQATVLNGYVNNEEIRENSIGDTCNKRAEHLNAGVTPPIAAQVPILNESISKIDFNVG